MTNPPPRSWVYLLRNPAALSAHSAQLRPRISRYSVHATACVRGEAVVQLSTDHEIVRLFCDAPLMDRGEIILSGTTQHLHYTNSTQRDHLLAISAKEFPAGENTLAVIILIRKSPSWWSLAHDQRMSFFNPSEKLEGHTAIGARFAPRIFRQLLHARYLDSAKMPYDFVTYFEFQAQDSDSFKALLANLRDERLNPEWNYVEMEQEIWLRKLS